MKQNESNRLLKELIDLFGIQIVVKIIKSENNYSILIIPQDIDEKEGFQIKLTIGWRSLNFEILFGNFSADLLQNFSDSKLENKVLFSKLVAQFSEEKSVFKFKLNDTIYNTNKIEDWPKNWKQFSFTLKVSNLDINTNNEPSNYDIIIQWTKIYLGCVFALVPQEEIDTKSGVFGMPEGTLKQILVNKYERNQLNRALCINFHGLNCKVCNINFQSVYGELGANFIHVHHITPVSQLGPEYIIDPIHDLIPVCPNCHSMLHKQDPPLSFNELKDIFFKINQSNPKPK